MTADPRQEPPEAVEAPPVGEEVHLPGPTPVPVVPGQYGIYGNLLVPYSRDFFTVLSN